MSPTTIHLVKSSNRSRLGCGIFGSCAGGAAAGEATVGGTALPINAGGFDAGVNEWSTEFGLLVGTGIFDSVGDFVNGGCVSAGEPGGVKLFADSAASVG